MKPKYYPAVTIGAAIALSALPVVLMAAFGQYRAADFRTAHSGIERPFSSSESEAADLGLYSAILPNPAKTTSVAEVSVASLPATTAPEITAPETTLPAATIRPEPQPAVPQPEVPMPLPVIVPAVPVTAPGETHLLMTRDIDAVVVQTPAGETPPDVNQPEATQADTRTEIDKSRPDSRRTRQRSNAIRSPAVSATTTAGNGTAGDDSAFEKVLLHRPSEGAPVAQIEDLLAVTTARGWPVAMIRSDLPDDVWWVQQIVGIQGNSFAGRVNFGNQHSVPGTEYRMVVVFLDTPDEVTRFRLAKQFKEIPNGIRRSREFQYVRN